MWQSTKDKHKDILSLRSQLTHQSLDFLLGNIVIFLILSVSWGAWLCFVVCNELIYCWLLYHFPTVLVQALEILRTLSRPYSGGNVCGVRKTGPPVWGPATQCLHAEALLPHMSPEAPIAQSNSLKTIAMNHVASSWEDKNNIICDFLNAGAWTFLKGNGKHVFLWEDAQKICLYSQTTEN